MEFAFEGMEVYWRALKWVEQVDGLLNTYPATIGGNLGEELLRRSLVVPLAIAEANGPQDARTDFFWIARKSALDCLPLIEILRGRKILSDAEAVICRSQIILIVEVLSRFLKK